MKDIVFENLYDIVSSKIYAVDINTYDIVYMNQLTKNTISNFGTKCYEKIYGYEQPCTFCKIDTLKNAKDNFIDFEAFNEVDNQWYDLHEKFVTIDNDKVVKYSAGYNITELKKVQNDYAHVYTQLLLKNKEIEELNKNLEVKIKQEVYKNLKQAKDLMQKSKMADMGQMIGAIAHQLKQPISVITTILGSYELYISIGKEIDIDQIHQKILKQAYFMNDTIDLFRNFFNPNKEKEAIFLDKIIRNTLSIAKDTINNIQVIEEYKELSSSVIVYPNELIQVCLNIIKNAKEILEEKDIKLKIIKFSAYEEDEYQVLSILDNAGGIPEDIKDKIFDQYFSTKSESKGTGIGLHLSRQILEQKHNGKLLVENKTFIYEDIEYQGACFMLYLKKES